MVHQLYVMAKKVGKSLIYHFLINKLQCILYRTNVCAKPWNKESPSCKQVLMDLFHCLPKNSVNFRRARTFSPSTPLTVSEFHITWFRKYTISFGYANINKDVHNIRNFNMEICGSYVMVFSGSHTYVQDKIKICLYCIFKSEVQQWRRNFWSILGITEIDKYGFGSPTKQEKITS